MYKILHGLDQGTILKLSRIPKIKEFCVFNEYEIFQVSLIYFEFKFTLVKIACKRCIY